MLIQIPVENAVKHALRDKEGERNLWISIHRRENGICIKVKMCIRDRANFRVAIDCVNSVGGIILPQLLEQLGVQYVEKLYCEPTGNFQHNPEPLEKNLGDIMNLMKGGKADVAFVVDPDVDRLATVSYTHLGGNGGNRFVHYEGNGSDA